MFNNQSALLEFSLVLYAPLLLYEDYRFYNGESAVGCQNLLQLVVKLFTVDNHLRRNFLDFKPLVKLGYPVDCRASTLNLQIRFLKMYFSSIRQEYFYPLAYQLRGLFPYLVSGCVEPLYLTNSVFDDEVLNHYRRT